MHEVVLSPKFWLDWSREQVLTGGAHDTHVT